MSRRRFLKSAAATTAGVAGLLSASCDQPEFQLDQKHHGDTEPEETDGWAVRMLGPEQIPAGNPAAWIFEVTVGSQGILQGGGIAFAIEHGADWLGFDVQRRPNKRWGGVYVETDGDAVLGYLIDFVSRASNGLEVQVLAGELVSGDIVRVTVGDDAAGGLWRAPTIAHPATIRTYYSHCGDTDDCGRTAYTLIDPYPVIEVTPQQVQRVTAIARSAAAPGALLSLLVRLEDGFGNIVPNVDATFDVLAEGAGGSLTPLGQVALSAESGGVDIFDLPVSLGQGVHRLQLQWRGKDAAAFSNPFEVTADPAHERIMWGQIHGHSLASDGLGTEEQWWEFARDKSLLDFASLADHGYVTEPWNHPVFLRHQINKDEWNRYAEVCRQYNEPGRFVTFLAYEWTSYLYSHKNIYFFNDTEPWSGYPTNPWDLASKYRGKDLTVVSHMMWGIPLFAATNWSMADPALESVVEVASVHGVREYAGNPYFTWDDDWGRKMSLIMRGHMVADAHKHGLRLGHICGSDCHTGMPGSDHRGRHPCRINGLMALRAPGLDRASIWQRWLTRQCYGTTGPRIMLDFNINGVGQGSEMQAGAHDPRQIEVEVFAPLPIVRIEIVKNDPTQPWRIHELDIPAWNPGLVVFEDDESLTQSTFYYARIFQEDGHMAWSSPIWIDPV